MITWIGTKAAGTPPARTAIAEHPWDLMAALCHERTLFFCGEPIVCWAVRNMLKTSLLRASSPRDLARLSQVAGLDAISEVIGDLRDTEALQLIEQLEPGLSQALTPARARKRLQALAGRDVDSEGAERAGGVVPVAQALTRTLRKHAFLGARRTKGADRTPPRPAN